MMAMIEKSFLFFKKKMNKGKYNKKKNNSYRNTR